MIRMTLVMRRRPEMRLEEFQEYWRLAHGPRVAAHAERLDILRYVQVHTLIDPANDALVGTRGKMEAIYDGATELWWRDAQALAAALHSSAGKAAFEELLADERQFVDLAASPLWFAHEYPQINPVEEVVARPRSPLVKLFYCLRHRREQSEVDAQRYWHTAHGPLIRSYAQAGGVLRYLQVHRFGTPFEARLREVRGIQAEGYTGHAELWFHRQAFLAATPESERAVQHATEDEATFIDFSRSVMWLAKEHVFIDRR
jgi:hypothetical protein